MLRNVRIEIAAHGIVVGGVGGASGSSGADSKCAKVGDVDGNGWQMRLKTQRMKIYVVP